MTLKGRGLTQRECLCTKCFFNVLPDSRALLYDSDTVDMSIAVDHADSSQVVDEALTSILERHFKNLKIGHVNLNSVAGLKFFQLKALMLKGLF